jgi:hypothetical protein
MTTPPLPDWYPDPSGKPGLMYWDGQRWHTDLPATPSPAEQPPSTALQPQRQTALITVLVLAVVVALAVVGIACYLVLQHSHTSRNPTAATSSEASVQPADPSAPTAQPAPSSTQTSPTSQYLKTQWGTTCEVTAQQVTCQECIPGTPLPARQTCADPAPGRAISTAGTIFETAAVTIDSSSDIQQLSNGETYHAFGWTIVGSAGWARFINDATGHGAALAAQNYDQF